MSVLHLEAGSKLPALSPGTLRLYSMKYCPFAQRTRLVLAHKNIPHEVVNINTKNKPDWFLEKNPLGLVPILECDGKVVYESGICDDYLDDIYPQNKLYPEDPYAKARMNILMERSGKILGAALRFLYSKDSPGEADALFAALQPFEEALDGDFFGGNTIGMLDLHMWPAFEKFDFIQELCKIDPLPKEQFPKLSAWCNRMALADTAQKANTEMKYFPEVTAAYRNGTMPNYDIGMEQY